jgi:hypothetical protein
MTTDNGSMNIWLVVGPILAALFGAVVGGFIRDWVVEKYYRPRLYILGTSVIQGFHYRIMVKNGGKRAAENCIGMITLDAEEGDIWEPPDGYIFSIDGPNTNPILRKGYFSPIKGMSLCWSRLGNPENCIINRDTKVTLEFCKVSVGSHLMIPSESGWDQYRVDLRLKEYSGELVITAANADPARAEFIMVPQDGNVGVEIVKRVPDWDVYQRRLTRRAKLWCDLKLKRLRRSKQDARTKEKA